MTGRVGDPRAQRIVLRPVDVESSNLHPGDRGGLWCIANQHSAADRPGAELVADATPEPRRDAIFPVGKRTPSVCFHNGCRVVIENCTGRGGVFIGLRCGTEPQ